MSENIEDFESLAAIYVAGVSALLGTDDPTAVRAVALKHLRKASGAVNRAPATLYDMRAKQWHIVANVFRDAAPEAPVFEGATDALGLAEAMGWLREGALAYHGWPHDIDTHEIPEELTLSDLDRRCRALRVSLSRNGGCHTMAIRYALKTRLTPHQSYTIKVTVWTSAAWAEARAARAADEASRAAALAGIPEIRRGRLNRPAAAPADEAPTQAELDDIAALQRRQDEIVNGTP